VRSIVLSPIRAIAGTLAAALGTPEALGLAAGAIRACNVTMLLTPVVWNIQAQTLGSAPAAH
jgi:hypothetical protein